MAGASNGAANAAKTPIGKVGKASGTVEVIHPDGTKGVLHVGDVVYQGDVIVTGNDGAVGITFADASTFALGKSGRMTIDELVYDPASDAGHSALSVVKGAFSYASGHIAKTAPEAATLKTPVMTIGIRGTTIAGQAAVEGEENTVSLLPDSDGGTGQIVITNASGSVVLNTVNQTLQLFSSIQPPPPPIILTPTQIAQTYGSAIDSRPPSPPPSAAPQDIVPGFQPPAAPQQDPNGNGDTHFLNPTPHPDPAPQPVPPGPIIGTKVGPDPFPRPDPRPDPGPDHPVRTDPEPELKPIPVGENLAPVFSGRSVFVGAMGDAAVTGNVQAIDPEGKTVTLSVPSTSAHGAIVTYDPATGDWSYMPSAAYYGVDTVTVTATDADGASATSTLTILVNQGTGSPPYVQGPIGFTRPEAGQWQSFLQDNIVRVTDDSTYVQARIVLSAGMDDSSGVCRITVDGVTTQFGGTFYVTGTVAQVNAALATLQYMGGNGENDIITVYASDGANESYHYISIAVPLESTFTGAYAGAPLDYACTDNWSDGIPGASDRALISGKSVTANAIPNAEVARLTLKNNGSLSILDTTFTAAEVAISTGAALTLYGSNSNATTLLTVGTSLTLDGGTVGIVSASVGGGSTAEYTQTSGATTISADAANATAMTFDMAVDVNGGTFTLDATAANLTETFIGQFTVGPDGTLILTKADNGHISSTMFSVGMENDGLFKSMGAGAVANSVIGDINNFGTLKVMHDLYVDGNIDNRGSGIVDIDVGKDLGIADNHALHNYGILSGDGSISLGVNTTLDNMAGGIIRPGGDNDVGTLTIDTSGSGGLSLLSGSTLELEYDGSTSHDRLVANGVPVKLGGTLSLDVDPSSALTPWGYTPEALITNLDNTTYFDDIVLAGGSNSKAIVSTWQQSITASRWDLMGQSSLFSSGDTATYSGSAYDETIFGATGLKNIIDGGAGNDTITGGNLADTLNGGDGSDWVYGGTGDDTITGGSGADLLFGQDGNDTINVSSNTVMQVSGGDGKDVLNWTGSNTWMIGPHTVSGVEVINMTGGGTISLNETTLMAMTSSISPDSGVSDIYIIGGNLHFSSGAWNHESTPSIVNVDMDGDGHTESYQQYTSSGDAHVYVSTDTNVTLP
ncbi:MAG: Ig-like domain-containing protein [Bacteroidota bacterium]